MLHENPSSHQLHSLKPIKEIRLRMFKQIYQKQKSNINIYDGEKGTEPRKSFLHVTRRNSTADCSQYASVGNLETSKSFHLNQYQTKCDWVSTLQVTNMSPKGGKQNFIINRIPIKIRSKRVNSKKELMLRQRNKNEQNELTSFYTKKLLQSPFIDDFICIERQYVIEENDEEI